MCECGCGQRVGSGRRFVHGHNRRGIQLSAATRQKITGRPVSSNERDVIHQWLCAHHPKAGRCEECGREGKTDYAFQRHPAAHTRERDDYRELCRSCHFRLDEPVIRRGPQLARSATSEQRRAAGMKGARMRWSSR